MSPPALRARRASRVTSVADVDERGRMPVAKHAATLFVRRVTQQIEDATEASTTHLTLADRSPAPRGCPRS